MTFQTKHTDNNSPVVKILRDKFLKFIFTVGRYCSTHLKENEFWVVKRVLAVLLMYIRHALKELPS